MPTGKIDGLVAILGEIIPLDAVRDDRGHPLAETLPDPADGPEEAAMHASLHQVLTRLLATLTERESEILRMRFGWDSQTEQTLEEVGHHFVVTRERIRQIEYKALRTLRYPSRSDALKYELGGPDGATVRVWTASLG